MSPRRSPAPVWGEELLPPARVAGATGGEGVRGAPAVLVALLPMAAALAALALAWATGVSRRDALPPLLDALSYGFFVERYPLYAFAIVYGIARLTVLAAVPGRASVLRRVAAAALGIAALLALSLYPTFGGMILRVGFMTGGVAFLQQMPMAAAYGLGAAAAAIAYGGTIGGAALLMRAGLPPPGSRRRALLRLAGTAILSVLALWLGALVLGLARDLGIGPWPRRALIPVEALRAGLILGAAALPHAVVCALRGPGGGSRG